MAAEGSEVRLEENRKEIMAWENHTKFERWNFANDVYNA